MFKERDVFGCDTETINGEPYSFQIVGEGTSIFVPVSRRSVLNLFVMEVFKLPNDSILYFHNLEFDLPVLFINYQKHFTDSSFSLVAGDVRFDILFGKVNHCDIYLGDKKYELVDSLAYFRTSLAAIAKKFGFENKLKKPRRLGEVKYKGQELEDFKRYAIRDSEIEFALGKKIQEFHRKYDVANTISAPQLSARIFRTQYIPNKMRIPSNPHEIDIAAVLSYHGGKNGMYVQPGIYHNVKVYDINSAYPFAMTQIPNFLECSYAYTKRLDRVHQGIYCVSGISHSVPYSTLFSHNFEPVVGRFNKVWITSYELACLISNKILSEFEIHDGYIVIENPKVKYNPLKSFAEDFYKLKSTTKGDLREFYKVMLNSLYGKFIQSTNNDTDEHDYMDLNNPETKPFFQAGGLWNPLLASLITGYVRAYLTQTEIQYKSLHTSTDSIMTRKWIRSSVQLGEWSLQDTGTVLLLRPKFYLIWDKNNHLVHYATHGYHGSIPMLLRILRSGKRKYFHHHMMKVRESLRQDVKPLVMKTLWKHINIPMEGKICLPEQLKLSCNRCSEWVLEKQWTMHRRRCNA